MYEGGSDDEQERFTRCGEPVITMADILSGSDLKLSGLNNKQIQRWYERGLTKMSQALRFEIILSKLMDFDIYFREFLNLDLASMETIRAHRDNVINLDTDDNEQEDKHARWHRTMLQCEHKECHRIHCKHKKDRLTFK